MGRHNIATKILSEKSKLENMLKGFLALEKDLVDLKELHQNFKNDEDQSVQIEILDLAKNLKEKS